MFPVRTSSRNETIQDFIKHWLKKDPINEKPEYMQKVTELPTREAPSQNYSAKAFKNRSQNKR